MSFYRSILYRSIYRNLNLLFFFLIVDIGFDELISAYWSLQVFRNFFYYLIFYVEERMTLSWV